MLSHMWTPHTLSPSYETPDYECRRQTKAIVQIWLLKDIAFWYEIQNLGLCTHSHTIKFSKLCRYIMKLWIMNVDTKAKVLLKFGSLETLWIDMRAKKANQIATLPIHVKLGIMYTLSHN